MGDGSSTGERQAVALLSGRPELDAATREALVQTGLPFLLTTDLSEARDRVAAGGVALLVFDAANPDPEAAAYAGELLMGAAASPPVVVLLPENTSANDEVRATAEYALTRPFPPATLALLCRSLATGEAGGARPEEERALRVRPLARFSARPLYAEAVAWVREVLEIVRAGQTPDLGPGKLVAERIHSSLLQSNLLLLRCLEPYARFELENHCVNVAVIATKVAIGLGLSLAETQRVILAGLVHDLGMTRVADHIVLKEGRLSDLEREEMERHPEHGAEILAPLGPEWEWLRRAVRQEHERLQGQGYPHGLSGDAIDGIARILGAADVFEALSQVRTYRSPFTLFEALEKVTSMRESYFDPKVIDALVSEVSVFPLDSYVQLDTGEIGRVAAVNASNLMRPTVELLWDADWEPLSEPRRVELAEHAEVAIHRPLHEAEVPIT